VVIGGGIVGASAAYRLAQSGVRAVLVDRADTGYATGAGAGIISPGTTHARPADYYPLAFAAVGFYPELLAALADDGERETGYAVTGALFVATSDEELARLPSILAEARKRQANGVPNVGEVRQLTGAEARELSPVLADIPAALHVPGSARIEARTLRQAMLRAAKQRGLTVVHGSAAILTEGDRATAVQVNGERIAAGAVIVAAGAWSADLAATLGFKLPIYPQRGQIMHLTMPEAETSGWPIISGFHSHYQLTFPPHRVVVGATREHHAGYDYRLTAGGVQEVLNEALRVSPGLGSATVEEIRIGFRPASPDDLPALGLAPCYRNVFLAAGHGPYGLQVGPYSGAAMADLVLGKTVALDLGPYSAARFQ
jgi:D-amino-acid dehydrogenase